MPTCPPIRSTSSARQQRLLRQGFSLLEVACGLIVITMFSVPLLTSMSRVTQSGTAQYHRAHLLRLAVARQNEMRLLARSGQNLWTSLQGNDTGDFSGFGQPELNWRVDWSQLATAGGVPDRLLAIQTVTWHDANGNRIWDSGETSCNLWTCVTKASGGTSGNNGNNGNSNNGNSNNGNSNNGNSNGNNGNSNGNSNGNNGNSNGNSNGNNGNSNGNSNGNGN